MRKTVASWLLSNGNIAISLDPEAEAAAGTLGSDDSMLLKNFYAPSPYHRNWKQYCEYVAHHASPQYPRRFIHTNAFALVLYHHADLLCLTPHLVLPSLILRHTSNSRLADARASPVEEGDHLALIGAANALSRHIIIISSIAGDQYFTKVSPSTIPGLRIANANQPLRLCHWQEAHYSSLTTMPEEVRSLYWIIMQRSEQLLQYLGRSHILNYCIERAQTCLYCTPCSICCWLYSISLTWCTESCSYYRRRLISILPEPRDRRPASQTALKAADTTAHVQDIQSHLYRSPPPPPHHHHHPSCLFSSARAQKPRL